MSRRSPLPSILGASAVAGALALALWLLRLEPAGDEDHGDASADGSLSAADPDAGAAARDAFAVPSHDEPSFLAAGLPPAPVEPLPAGENCSVTERVDELVDDLKLLAWAAPGPGNPEARRLERFVLDTIACGAPEETVDALLQRIDIAQDERLKARLLMLLAPLGAGAEIAEHWDEVPRADRPQVLLTLAWDPLREGHGLPLPSAAIARYLGSPAPLPLTLARAPDPAARAWVVERLHAGDTDERGERAAAAVVVGAGGADWPEAPDLLVEAVLGRPRECRAALYMLLRDDDPRSRRAIDLLRRRYGGFRGLSAEDLEGHEHFALELAEVESAARAERLADPAWLAAIHPGTPAPESLEAAGLALAALVDGGLPAGRREALSDALCAALSAESDASGSPSDADSSWATLLALVRLHVHEHYEPSLSIGYDTDEPVDVARAEARTAVFLGQLADPRPAQRRLAVMGLFGATDGELVREALAAALASEGDREVASWIRLALIRL